MEKNVYDYILKKFSDKFKGRDYIVESSQYEDFFTSAGKRDRRRKYFHIHIAIKNLRRFDIVENTKLLGELFVASSTLIGEVEDKYEDVIFNTCSYDGNGIVEIKFCLASEIALRELTAGSKSFNVERW